MTTIKFATVLLAGFAGLAALAYYITHIAESGVNSEAKTKLSNIVKNFKATPTIRHSFMTFTMLSDNVFGERLVSFRAIGASCLLSFLWISVVTITCSFVFPSYTAWIIQANLMIVIIKFAIPILLAILLIDYASLTMTRILVRTLKVRTLLGLTSTLVLDFIVSVFLFYIGLTSVKYWLVNPSWISLYDSLSIWVKLDAIPTEFKTLQDLTSDMLVKNADGSFEITGGLLTEVVYAFPEGVAFYSSLLTSIWLWLHILSYGALKMAIQTDSIKDRLLKLVNINEKPFSALATIILILYFPISILLIALYSIFQLP